MNTCGDIEILILGGLGKGLSHSSSRIMKKPNARNPPKRQKALVITKEKHHRPQGKSLVIGMFACTHKFVTMGSMKMWEEGWLHASTWFDGKAS